MKYIKYLILLIAPTIVSYLAWFYMNDSPVVLVVMHGLTAIYVFFHAKYRFAPAWILPTSILLTPLAIYIYETLYPQRLFQYFAVWVWIIVYALPAALLPILAFFSGWDSE